MSFKELGLSDFLSKSIETLYKDPTPLQEKVIPAVLENQNLLITTRAGTGRLASFILPIIEQLFPNGQELNAIQSKQAQALILINTPEQALRVIDYSKAYSAGLPMSFACLIDGQSITPQVKMMEQGVHVLIANPKRLIELIAQKAIDLTNTKSLVIEQNSSTVSENLQQQLEEIAKELPLSHQTLLFTSTISQDILALSSSIMENPTKIDLVTSFNIETIKNTKQSIYHIPARQKPALLAHIINKNAWNQILIFVRTRHTASRLVNSLDKAGIKAKTVHGNKNYNILQKTLNDFKNQNIHAIVTTDNELECFGITQLPYVINFDLPFLEQEYVQRVNYTTETGEAISLISPEEEKFLLAIEEVINYKIPDGDMADFVFEEPEHTNKDNDQFKKIFRHPATGRKSRMRRYSNKTQQQNDIPTPEEQPSNQKNNRRPYGANKKNYSQPRNNQPHITQPLEMPPDRPEDEFRDDEYDNFGNSVNYVSPYKKKPTQHGNVKTTTTHRAPSQKKTTAQRTPKNSLYRRNTVNTRYTEMNQSLPEPQERPTRTSGITPAIIHRKHSRSKLPTIEQLDNLPSHHIVKTEKPALLKRKTHEEDDN